jgi:hypothetical protein
MPTRCLALIGDLVGSSGLSASERHASQRALEGVCDRLNREREALDVLSDYTITLGDEFQALHRSAGGLWRAVQEIECALFPVAVRFAVGVGDIVTDLRPDAALGMDGPAFHGARRGIEGLKGTPNRYRVDADVPVPTYVNPALELVSHLKQRWRRNRHVAFLDHLNDAPAADTARRLDISLQAVYQNGRDGAFEPLGDLLRVVSGDLDRLIAGPMASAPAPA